MQDDLGAIARIAREREHTLEQLQKCEVVVGQLANLHKNWVPGSPPDLEVKLGELEETLQGIEQDMEEHRRSEEEDILPILVEHAGEIIYRGLTMDHDKIVKEVADLRARVHASFGWSAGREERITQEMDIRGSIGVVLTLMRTHCDDQAVIYRLAREVLVQEQEEN